MGARVGRMAASTVLATGIGLGSAVLAAPVADAAQPVVVGSCDSTVRGTPGAPVSIDLGAVLGIGHGPVVPIGAIPQAGARSLNAASAAQANKGPLEGLVGGISGTLQKVLSGGCDVLAKSTNAVAAPIQDAAKPATDAMAPGSRALADGLTKAGIAQNPDKESPANPGGSGSTGPSQQGQAGPPSTQPGPQGLPPQAQPALPQGVPAGVPLAGQLGYGQNGLTSPASLYSAVPQDAPGFGTGFGVPGMYAASGTPQYGNQVPGAAPSFGQIPGQAGNGQQSLGDPVRTAGRATALDEPRQPSNGNVGLPLLVAVLAVTAVTAGLVRTWVVKKATQ